MDENIANIIQDISLYFTITIGIIVILAFGYMFRKPLSLLISNITRIDKRGIEIDQPKQNIPKSSITTDYEILLKSYVSPSVRSLEKIITGNLKKIESTPDEKIKILIRDLAHTRLHLLYERIFLTCWLSQFQLLEHLNALTIPARLDVIKSLYYDASANLSPQVFENYSFENYIKFLTSNHLIEVNNDMCQISEIGKGYIVYLAETGSRKALAGNQY